ncbi:cyclopropane-fatty-acyl-phospholipid synthase family protein [Allorhizobium sp. BGMRC 0089]|uniref:SAM-dependent methyltransferase n=1 Tax=Allorhizobium sonneratiae TaxID=2934936 RepID=UPI0020346AC0|nr:cyclopropane-fatty-acyl-phospholipid synthase family protein [Allorhizobium sonneratiae]MCM2291803.1 cyclopropane-fatty-acyl-phospholipid synthase family protein [Allorhizobium sonneratiae]
MSHADQQSLSFIPSSAPFWQKILSRWADRITSGQLTLIFPGGQEHHAKGNKAGPSAILKLNNARPLRRLMAGGSLGFSRAYLEGDWDSPDITALLELAILNEVEWSRIMSPSSLIGRLALLRHRLRANSRAGSRRNIAFHYDLGNEFYQLWLDETMTYSSALFSEPGQSLAAAQTAKYARIVEALRLNANDRVLEIGCGWGGFAEEAIRTAGCHVTGLTLSTRQAEFARSRLSPAGPDAQVDIRLQDYRDVKGTFSKIVSIEMFEAVGEENWPVYFNRLRDLLDDKGEAVVQVITIEEDRFDYYRRNADFIQTYIFPGGMLPSIKRFKDEAGKAGLTVKDAFCFGRDYEKTLLLWEQSFISAWPRISRLGFDERFYRMWRYYLNYCAAGFRTGRLNVVQFHLQR